LERFRSGIPGERYDGMVDRLVRREISPGEAVDELMK
jgi:hypothetical protein